MNKETELVVANWVTIILLVLPVCAGIVWAFICDFWGASAVCGVLAWLGAMLWAFIVGHDALERERYGCIRKR